MVGRGSQKEQLEQHNSFSRTSHLNSRALRLQQLCLFEEVLHGSLGTGMVLPRHGSWRFVMDRGDTLRHGSTCARKLQLRAGSYTCDSRHTRSTCVQTLRLRGKLKVFQWGNGWYGNKFPTPPACCQLGLLPGKNSSSTGSCHLSLIHLIRFARYECRPGFQVPV